MGPVALSACPRKVTVSTLVVLRPRYEKNDDNVVFQATLFSWRLIIITNEGPVEINGGRYRTGGYLEKQN